MATHSFGLFTTKIATPNSITALIKSLWLLHCSVHSQWGSAVGGDQRREASILDFEFWDHIEFKQITWRECVYKFPNIEVERGMIQVWDMRKILHIRLQVRHRYTVRCVMYLQCMELSSSFMFAQTPAIYRRLAELFTVLVIFRITEGWKLRCCTKLQKRSTKRPQSMPYMTHRCVDRPCISWCLQIILLLQVDVSGQAHAGLVEDIWSRRGLG